MTSLEALRLRKSPYNTVVSPGSGLERCSSKLKDWSRDMLETYLYLSAGIRAAGGLFSTVKDLLTFLKTNMGVMETLLMEALQLTHEKRIKGKSGHLGLSWFIDTLPTSREEFIYSDGVIGGYTSFIGFHKSSQTAVVVLQNSINYDDRIGRTLLDRLVRPAGLNEKAYR